LKGQIKLDDVLYIPSVRQNLMLVGTLADTGNVVVFMKYKCFVLKNSIDRFIIRSNVRDNNNGLYKMGNSITYDANNVTINDAMRL